MQFDEPVVAGQKLVRYGIQSYNYAAGVAGWAIFRNGNAEFNNILIRGSVIVNSNTGERIEILVDDAGKIRFYPAGTVVSPGFIQSGDAGPYTYVTIASPQKTAFFNPGQLFIGSEPNNGVPYPGFPVTAPIAQTNGDLDVRFIAKVGDKLLVGPDGDDPGRGPVGTLSSNVSSAAIGATETVLFTSPVITWRANRTYLVRLGGAFSTSVASQRPAWRLHKGTTTAGTTLCFGVGPVSAGAGTSTDLSMVGFFKVGNADVTSAVCLTVQGSASSTVTHLPMNGGRFVSFRDDTDAAEFPDATAI